MGSVGIIVVLKHLIIAVTVDPLKETFDFVENLVKQFCCVSGDGDNVITLFYT